MTDYAFHYEETRSFVSYQCPHCLKQFPLRRIAERHRIACQQTEADAAEREDSDAVRLFAAHVASGQQRRDGRAGTGR